MKKRFKWRVFLIVAFALLMSISAWKTNSLLKNNNSFISQNCYINERGVEICDDCDKAHDPLTGTSGIQSDKNPECNTRDRDCWPGHVAYYSWGCGCVECATCNNTEPEPVCVDSTSTSYSISCAKTTIQDNETTTCICQTTTYHTCYANENGSNQITVNPTSCGKQKVVCGDKTAYVDVKCPACYRKNGETPNYVWAYDSPGSNYTKVTNIKTKNDCQLSNPDIPNHCVQSTIPGEKSKEASSCESTATLPLDEEKVCSDSVTSQFYTINCRETISSKFKPGNLALKAGQGFVFDIELSTTYTCEGSFDKTAWNEAYSNLQKGLERANKLPNGSDKTAEIKWYNNKISNLNSFYTSYRITRENYMQGGDSDGISDALAKLKITYKKNKKNNTLSYNFITKDEKTVIDSSNTKYTNNMKLSTGEEVKAFKSKVTKTKNLMPPKVLFNKDGSINTNGVGNTIDGGNHFMIELETDPGNYSFSIEITNLGVNHSGKITNNACNLNVYDRDYLYRIIDVNNPFDIQNLTPGENWISNNYNFENTINSSTWSDNYLYKFDLSKDDIKDIKESNGNYANPYLGICDGKSSIFDDITRKLCNQIK